MPDLYSLVCSSFSSQQRKMTRKMMRIQKMDLHFLQSQVGLHLLQSQVDLHLLQYNQLINQQQAHLLQNPHWNALLIEMNSRLQLTHILQMDVQIPNQNVVILGTSMAYLLVVGVYQQWLIMNNCSMMQPLSTMTYQVGILQQWLRWTLLLLPRASTEISILGTREE